MFGIVILDLTRPISGFESILLLIPASTVSVEMPKKAVSCLSY